MTDDQIRVRVTVTVTTAAGTAHRSSIVERIQNENTPNRLDNFLGGEVVHLRRPAWLATKRAAK